MQLLVQQYFIPMQSILEGGELHSMLLATGIDPLGPQLPHILLLQLPSLGGVGQSPVNATDRYRVAVPWTTHVMLVKV